MSIADVMGIDPTKGTQEQHERYKHSKAMTEPRFLTILFLVKGSKMICKDKHRMSAQLIVTLGSTVVQ